MCLLKIQVIGEAFWPTKTLNELMLFRVYLCTATALMTQLLGRLNGIANL
jgi:hypothetical protein